MAKNEIDGLGVPQLNSNEHLSESIDLYIGVFFDGTNNNKYQVMLGKQFRRKEIYRKYSEKLKRHGITNATEMMKQPPSFWKDKGIDIATSDYEKLYFGYLSMNLKEDENATLDYFVEKKNLKTLQNNNLHEVAARPDSEQERNKLMSAAQDMIDATQSGNYDAYEGASAQNATYTNVAILESLYNVADTGGGEFLEKHFSIYIEGSGTDMQIGASTTISHKGGNLLMGLGKGTGPTGVEAKVRKAAIMVRQLISRYTCEPVVKDVKVHFDICGFSRGSTCARLFCYVINANPDNPKTSYGAINSIINTGKKQKDQLFYRFTQKKEEFLTLNGTTKVVEKSIRNLLIADTVASIGVIYNKKALFSRPLINTIGSIANMFDSHDAKLDWDGQISHTFDKQTSDAGTEDVSAFGLSTYHYQNVDDYGLWANALAQYTIHICALDEIRENFALVDIESSLCKFKSSKIEGLELFIPGCHTDIGGAAAIGLEDAYILNKDDKRRFFRFMGHSKKYIERENLLNINQKTLKQLGWIPDSVSELSETDKDPSGRALQKYTQNNDTTSFSDNYYGQDRHNDLYTWHENGSYSSSRHNNIIMYRHVKPGYSNIALAIFHSKAKDKPFNSIPYSYEVPQELDYFKKELLKYDTGRHFLYPADERDYKKLRENYIHFSCNEQFIANDIANNSLVNGPEFAPYKIDGENILIASRIIYKGAWGANNEKDEGRIHLFDYDQIGEKVQIFK